ncbi:tol-pal system protein YbgF [Pseudoxanthomonas wuyuanensis]|uniref:Cell division coordinator CpoB n=1 Tax=Pseudoxanthomonas wuyuanensis TaxID=1073196 RepID=A0A286D4M1_9GAMM|nr:tol-pal system protein YbgF [Pseudoxanthomonas wuyuanensis]KAF1719774.1 tol-pal system protein YbgF [Pseudoxanthomonas wuyuanensis]SOD53597.1 tol-pal system protein YbgF [Pseudoxanthomonas wuyuanensis]
MALTKQSMLVLAAALVAAAPAHAQRQSLADRVSALEIQANNNQGNMDLLNRVTQQENELRQLREQIELLQNELEQIKQRNRDQYLDLDGRLNRLEGGVPGAVPPVAVPSGGTAAAPVAPTVPVAATAVADAAPRVHGDVGALAQAGDERTAYNVAFDKLKAGDYVDSAQLFTSFLELYPNGVYAPNALYWLGESYYVTQNYELAAQQFRALLERYPTHDKAAGSLLKLGLSEYGLGQVERAERTLGSVVSQYPGSDVARTADDRLRAIQLGRVR